MQLEIKIGFEMTIADRVDPKVEMKINISKEEIDFIRYVNPNLYAVLCRSMELSLAEVGKGVQVY